MTAIELKKELIQKILEINDVALLKALKTILEIKSGNDAFELSEEKKNEILKSKEDIKKGLYTEGETFDKEVLKWLGTK
jgi:hypothetical protein